MPLTLFAHQVPTIGLKMVRPRWFDGTALCIGSMAPDLAYAFSGPLRIDSHEWPATATVVVPLTLVLATVIRWSTASVAAAHLPDVGPARLHSWRVLHRRQPSWWITVTSAALGVFTHVALDSFTHPGRPGARLLGYDDVTVELWGRSEPLAGVFQLLGHTLGSLAGAWMLVVIGSRRLLERWYGDDVVDQARRFTLTPRSRWVFWSVTAAGVAGGLWAGWGGDRVELIQRPLLAGALAVMIAAGLPVCRPAE